MSYERFYFKFDGACMKKQKSLAQSSKRNLACAIRSVMFGLCLGSSVIGHAEQPTQQYHVNAGALGTALSSFALQSGIALSFDPALTRGLKSQGLNGHYQIEQGFAELLKNTSLIMIKNQNGTWSIVSKNHRLAQDAETQSSSQYDENNNLVLPTIVMTANQLGEITENTGSYTAGKIATATRLVLTQKETPQTISVVTRQELDDYNLNNIDAVMSHTPGITVAAYDSERTSYYSRGFAINNFQYDGIPSTTRNVGYAAGNTLSDSAIYDRFEVLKGSTGLLTGGGSSGATINLVRKKPTHDFQAIAKLGAGSWHDYRGEFDVGGPLNQSGSVRGRFVTALEDKESFMDRYERKSYVFYGITEFDLSDNTLLTIGADYQNNKPKASTWSGSFPLFNSKGERNPYPSRSFNNAANWSKWEQYTRSVFANVHHDFANDWQLTMQYDHKINGYDASLGTIQGYYPLENGSAKIWPSKYVGRTVSDSFEVYTTGKFNLLNREHDLVLGASAAFSLWKGEDWTPNTSNPDGDNYYDTRIPSFEGWDGHIPEPTWGNPTALTRDRTIQYGVYATSRLNLTDQLKTILGTRLINYKMKGLEGKVEESNRLIPYVGVLYDFNDKVTAYASVTDIFMPQDIWYKDSSNKILDPDEGKNYELGFKFQPWGEKFNASIAYFQIHQSNRAVEDKIYNGDPTNPDVDFAWQGIKAKTKGVELEASGEILPGLEIGGGYTHKIIKDGTGEKVSTWEPEHQVSLSSSYKFTGALDGLTAGAHLRWQSKAWQTVYNRVKQQLEDINQDQFVTVDLMANYQITPQLNAAVNFNNIFDKTYFTNVGFYNSAIYGNPRNVMLSLKFKY